MLNEDDKKKLEMRLRIIENKLYAEKLKTAKLKKMRQSILNKLKYDEKRRKNLVL